MTQPLYNTRIKFSASCSPSHSAIAEDIPAISLQLSSELQPSTPWVFNHASVNALGKNEAEIPPVVAVLPLQPQLFTANPHQNTSSTL